MALTVLPNFDLVSIGLRVDLSLDNRRRDRVRAAHREFRYRRLAISSRLRRVLPSSDVFRWTLLSSAGRRALPRSDALWPALTVALSLS